jgi:hypothetical protein
MIFRRSSSGRHNPAAMTVFPDTQAAALQDSRRPVARESFLSQTPLALMAIVAVAAIVAVNTPETPESPVASPAPASRPAEAPASCADCGEIVSIRPIPAAELGAAGSEHGYALEVRMNDGSLRIVKQFASGFDVGDRVRLNGNALTVGG